jgi:hypothetical protein
MESPSKLQVPIYSNATVAVVVQWFCQVTTKRKLKNYTDLFNGEGGGGGLSLPRAPFFLKLVLTISIDHKLICP